MISLSDGTATRYGLNGSCPETHPASCTMCTGSLSRRCSGRSVALTNQPLPAPKLSMGKAIALPPLSTCLAFYEPALFICTFLLSPVCVAVSKFIKSKYAHINKTQPTVRKFPFLQIQGATKIKAQNFNAMEKCKESSTLLSKRGHILTKNVMSDPRRQ